MNVKFKVLILSCIASLGASGKANIDPHTIKYQNFLEYQYARLKVEDHDIYRLIYLRLIEDGRSRKDSSPEYKSIIDQYVSGETFHKISEKTRIIYAKHDISAEERRDLALLSIVNDGDFSFAEKETFEKDSARIRDYIYTPLESGAKPRDHARWESIILRSCKGELNSNHKKLIDGELYSISNPYLYEMWLAKYGESKKTKAYLLNLPFERGGMVYVQRQVEWGELVQNRTGLNCQTYLEWYIEHVLAPAGLCEQFNLMVEEMEEYLEQLKNTSQGSVKNSMKGMNEFRADR
jgi:hypothetical protein